MREQVIKLMKSHPSFFHPVWFNPLWSLIYPIVRRGDGSAGYVESHHSDNRTAFETIYQNNDWGIAETRSGWGSTMDYTAPLRNSLEKLTRKLGTRVMLDAPCGDFNWMQHVSLPENCRYIGGDIVAPLVAELRARYAQPERQFQVIDIVEDKLPQADLWLCRDVLFHLPTADVIKVLKNFARSQVSYMLTTTYDFQQFNADVKPGGFRYVNLRRPPFSLVRPKLKIADFVAPAPPRYLGLWSRAQVAASMGLTT
jgi:hypothetical protein